MRRRAHGMAAGLTVSLFLLMMTGCSSAYLAAHSGHPALAAREGSAAAHVEQQLRDVEREWHGTPYRYGGTSRDGIDCSAFVREVFDDVFEIQLPRTTVSQVEVGHEVSPRTLQAGDLVFFRTSRRTRHVGIYLGDGEFAHASTSQGVMTSRLDDSYWRRTYWTTRRILPTIAADASSPRTTMPLKKVTPAPRTGW